MEYSILQGDSLELLRTLPDNAVDCCVTSPPYYGLRDYKTDGQLGLEQSLEEYVGRLVKIFNEVRRVLKDDGTLWLNLGDSFATRSGSQAPTNTRNKCGHTAKAVPAGYKAKDLIGIPWMVAFSLRSSGWYLRQDIIWHKPNCMPESVKDRCTKSHEYIFLLSKCRSYYFDAEAISEPITGSSTKRYLQNLEKQRGSDRQPGRHATMKSALPRFGGEKYGDSESKESRTKSGAVYVPTLRRNKRDVWTVSTAGFKGAHFATFPEKLIEPCILAGSKPEGIVLDPFSGSGTTGAVAIRNGRKYIGIEINPEYVELSKIRLEEAQRVKTNTEKAHSQARQEYKNRRNEKC